MLLSLIPLYLIDICGSMAMLVLSILCMQQAVKLYLRDRENALSTYILWLTSALFSFCLIRPLGHFVKYYLLFTHHATIWQKIAPISGSLITVTFIVIFASTLFFGSMLLIMNRMIRDRKKVEETSSQLLELNKDIESVVSDRTRAELALQLAHEIRNPVMVISGLLHRMTCKQEDQERNSRYRDTVLGQTTKLEAIVNRFEELQSDGEDHFSAIEINELTKDSVKIIQAEAEIKGISIAFFPAAKPLFCRGDARYLKVALLHILRNSLESCSAGDSIRVDTKQISTGASITIIDDGPGIPSEVLEHIFEPFFSTKEGSTGLGLPYVRQIIREHRGEITIESTFGQGCTVTIILPTHLSELQRSAPNPAGTTKPPAR